MKHLKYLLILLVLVTYGACEDEPTYGSYLSADQSLLEFPSYGGELLLAINCDAGWGIMDKPDWVTLSLQRGYGDKNVNIMATPNTDFAVRQDSLLIQTADGRRKVSVMISQPSASLTNAHLWIQNTNKRWMNGDVSTAGSRDSILIEANVPWAIEGPKWLRAEIEGNPILLTGSTLTNGTAKLIIYPYGTYYSYGEDREGVIRISSPYIDDYFEIPVAQLGSGRVEPKEPLIMAHGIATEFKYGTEIDFLWFKTFSGTALEDDLTYDAARSWTNFNFSDDLFISTSALQPNSPHELCVRTSFDGYFNGIVNHYQFQTVTDANQPEADIQNVKYQNGTWYWSVKMNSQSLGYYMILYTTNQGWNEMYTAYLSKWNIDHNPESFPLYDSDGEYYFNTTGNILIAVWAVGRDGRFSNVLSSYDCTHDSANIKKNIPLKDAVKHAKTANRIK